MFLSLDGHVILDGIQFLSTGEDTGCFERTRPREGFQNRNVDRLHNETFSLKHVVCESDMEMADCVCFIHFCCSHASAPDPPGWDELRHL